MVASNDFDEMIRDLKTAPLLFVGAGLSRRYRGLPSWRELLEQFAPKSVDQYLAAAGGDYPSAGTEIANDFFARWWKDKKYENSRQQHSALVGTGGKHGPIKVEIARMPGMRGPSTLLPNEIAALKAVKPEAVITTNYDNLMEEIFPDFKVFIGQKSMLFASQGVGEIFKIHGCASEPLSIVLTKEDYDRFHSENYYLIAKLATTLVQHPIVFLGYSLTDKYIQVMLERLMSCMTPQQTKEFGRRVVFVERAEGETTVVRGDHYFGNGVRLPCYTVKTESFIELFEALGRLERSVPARVLRFLRENVYQLVEGAALGKQVYFVTDLDGVDLDTLDVVVGVGVRGAIGYKGLTRDDVAEDVLAPTSKLDSKKVLQDVLPNTGTWLPVWRYIGKPPVPQGVHTTVSVNAKRPLKDFRDKGTAPQLKLAEGYASVDALFAAHKSNPQKALNLVVLRTPSRVDVEQLRRGLLATKDSSWGTSSHKSVWMKALCFYDRLAFGPPLK